MTGTRWDGRTVPTMTAYTPTRTGFSLGDGTETARYTRGADNLIQVRYSLRFGSTTAISGSVSVGLPVAASSSGEQVLTAWVGSNGGATLWPALAYIAAGASSADIYLSQGSGDPRMAQLGSFGLTFGASSLIAFSGAYEPS